MKRQLLLIGTISGSGTIAEEFARCQAYLWPLGLRIPDTSMVKCVRTTASQPGRAPLPRFTTIWNE